MMKILQVNQQTGSGGAAALCLSLHNGFRAKGIESAVLVGRQKCILPGVSILEHDRYRSGWARSWMTVARMVNRFSGRVRGAQRISERWLPLIASPGRLFGWWIGHEDFEFPGTRFLYGQAPFLPDILHLHNLHGDFFDLRDLSLLSQKTPTIITLHDAWLLAGHCSHSFECDRWKTGCGSCPRLDIPPALHRDGTAFNWQRKQRIFQRSRLALVCPSHWLADKVKQSMLNQGADFLRVIPNGVDLSIFKPGDKGAARAFLGWPQEEFIVIFAATGVRRNMWKDFATMRMAIRLAQEKQAHRVIRFFAIGEAAPTERVGQATIEFLPYREQMTVCYQAADVYLHAANADTFPTSIIEALSCGTPVVATAVGGIPEQIVDGVTGYLVAQGDASALAERLVWLAQSPVLTLGMSVAASRDATARFSHELMLSNYEKLYQEVIEKRNCGD